MSISRDKTNNCWRFDFDRVVKGQRVRSVKRLPQTWDRAEADAYDRTESARLYAVATGVEIPIVSIEDAVRFYERERCPELKHGRAAKLELANTYWAYRGKPITQVPEVCALIRKQWTGKLAPATIRNRIRYLTAAVRWAWKHHKVCEHDPAARVVAPSVSNERHVYTDRAGMLKLARSTACRETRAAIRIGFYSGMRMGEIRKAVVENGMFKLYETKNGMPRWVSIDDRIKTCLRYIPFTSKRSTIDHRFRAARAAAGMPHFHFHDLRHSAASEMINSGADLNTVGAVLGHLSQQSTKRYAHLATASLAVAMSKIGRRAKTDFSTRQIPTAPISPT